MVTERERVAMTCDDVVVVRGMRKEYPDGKKTKVYILIILFVLLFCSFFFCLLILSILFLPLPFCLFSFTHFITVEGRCYKSVPWYT